MEESSQMPWPARRFDNQWAWNGGRAPEGLPRSEEKSVKELFENAPFHAESDRIDYVLWLIGMGSCSMYRQRNLGDIAGSPNYGNWL